MSAVVNATYYKRSEDCPDAAKHSPSGPSGYTDWFEWAQKKGETHDQLRCPTCGFYVIWKRKRVGAPRESEEGQP